MYRYAFSAKRQRKCIAALSAQRDNVNVSLRFSRAGKSFKSIEVADGDGCQTDFIRLFFRGLFAAVIAC